MNELDILIYLGKLGAFSTQIPITTSRIGSDLGESQQNVSRWLIKMEKEGLIYRKDGIKGYLVQITPEGERMLVRIKGDIEIALTKKDRITLKGKIVTGIGDGKYYMGLEKYSSCIEKNFGFRPYPGTLNVKLTDMSDIRQKEKIAASNGSEVPGFVEGNRVFGALKCFGCLVNGKKCALIIPERSHHSFDILEIVSPLNLRRELKISDGDEVRLDVDLNL
jgi:riboflavin kinase, archaea type